VTERKRRLLSSDFIARFDEDSPKAVETRDYIARLLGKLPQRDPLPEDMPAIERMKHYARLGFNQYHIGGAEEFERTWNEVFPAKKGGKK
jgi:hypothetical protein